MESKGSEKINDEGAIETKVETVDIQSPPEENREPRMENVGVVHLTRNPRNKEGQGVMASAAEAVEKSLESAKEAISGRDHGSNK